MKIIRTHNYLPKTSKFRYKNFNMLASNYKQKQKWFCCHQQPKWIQIKLLKSQWIVARNINLLALFWILFICMREIIDYAVAYRAWCPKNGFCAMHIRNCNVHSKRSNSITDDPISGLYVIFCPDDMTFDQLWWFHFFP